MPPQCEQTLTRPGPLQVTSARISTHSCSHRSYCSLTGAFTGATSFTTDPWRWSVAMPSGTRRHRHGRAGVLEESRSRRRRWCGRGPGWPASGPPADATFGRFAASLGVLPVVEPPEVRRARAGASHPPLVTSAPDLHRGGALEVDGARVVGGHSDPLAEPLRR